MKKESLAWNGRLSVEGLSLVLGTTAVLHRRQYFKLLRKHLKLKLKLLDGMILMMKRIMSNMRFSCLWKNISDSGRAYLRNILMLDSKSSLYMNGVVLKDLSNLKKWLLLQKWQSYWKTTISTQLNLRRMISKPCLELLIKKSAISN